jgi:hypothetical protein
MPADDAPPRTVVLTLFLEHDAFPARTFVTGEAQRHVARLLALRILRGVRAARLARRASGYRLRRITLAGGPAPFDHAVGTFRFPAPRTRIARLDATFHLGTSPAGSAHVTLRLGPPRPRSLPRVSP